MKLDTLGKKATAATAIIIFLGLVYKGFDLIVFTTSEAVELEKKHDADLKELTTFAQSTNDMVLLQRWKLLKAKQVNQGLTAEESVEYCQISRYLGLKGQGCA